MTNTTTTTHSSPYVFVFICGIIVTIIAFTAAQVFFPEPTKNHIHNHFYVKEQKLENNIKYDFAANRPVTVYEQGWDKNDMWNKRELGKGVARSSEDKSIVVEMDTGHLMNVYVNLIRFDDVKKDD